MLKILLLGLFIMSNLNAKHTNALINEDSPYLLQHAHNPVNWYPWSDEAFNKAKKENKLIFLSIGYSTCHWCHVMERESFENEEVAKILNKDFISIKVDREEYPHIDRHYQDIYMLMNRRGGGWPLTIIMTPDAKTFFSGTYMPADNRYGRSGLKGMLKALKNAYKNRKDEVIKSVKSIEDAMDRMGSAKQKSNELLDITITKNFVDLMKAQFDQENGGFGTNPKFPHATTLDTLLDIYRITRNKSALNIAEKSLLSMSKGGIYDQIEGGFFRYSIDEMWIIPHFEKMLYTNAELLEAYINGYALTKKDRFKEVIEETIQNIDERFNKDNLYYSASDADSDDEEGKYFVFEYKKILNELIKGGFSKDESKYILEYYSIDPNGNFEGSKSNPYLSGLEKPKNLQKAKEILRANREKKNYAFIDYKIQTSWNSLYLVALFKAGKHIDTKYSQKALKSIDELLKNLYIKGELYHQMIIGKEPKVKGYLEDYAFLISALIEAYQVDFDEKYLNIAKTLSDQSVMKFYKNGVWYMSDDNFKSKAELYDSSYRSALAVMIENLFKIAILSDNLKLQSFAQKSLNSQLGEIKYSPNQHPYAIKTYLQSLLSIIVIKSTKENLLKNKKELNSINYPYTLLKPTKDKNFLACKIDHCFAMNKSLNEVIKKIK